MLSKFLLLALFFSALCLVVFAQTNANRSVVTGKITDSTAKQPLKNASIRILRLSDSSLIAAGLSKDDGSFSISKIAAGDYVLWVSYQGYETFQKTIIASNDSSINVGNIYLQTKAHELKGVTVTAAPVEIKNDTTQFNAGMYHTKPNGTVEDLLKKMEGMEVDKQGNVKAQGETVQRILVNGKRFFGDDPKMATQNLPAEIVDKIQVFDQLSDQSAFTGFDDGNRTKTINIVTKQNARQGYFGKFTAGTGNKGLYALGATVSRFKGDEQISFISQLNNTNQQVFTIQDILGTFSNNSNKGFSGGSMDGGAGGLGGPPGGGSSPPMQMSRSGSMNMNNNEGIITTKAAGLNYANTFGRNTQISASYFYNNLIVEADQKKVTENFIQSDSSQFENQNSLSKKTNQNQRFSFNIETQFDSSNALIIRPNFTYQNTTLSSQTKTNITKEKLIALSNTTANTEQDNSGYNGSVDATYRHKLKKKGRTFILGFNYSGNTNDGTGKYFSVVDNIQSLTKDTSNQHYISDSKGNKFSTTVAYTEPVGKNQLIELNFNNTHNYNTSSRITYNYDSITRKFSLIDTALSNQFENTYNANRVTLNYLIRNDKMNFSAGAGALFGNLNSYDKTRGTTLTQQYVNIYPTINFNYRFSKTKNLRVNYSGRPTQPTVQQLQPVRDESDPTNIKIGNPDLSQEFTHTLRMLFTSFDTKKFKNIFATINASVVQDDISSAITLLSNGTQITQPVNLNGSYNVSGFFNYGFQVRKPKSNLNFTTNFTRSKTASLINDAKNNTLNNTIGESLRWTTNLKDKFDMNFSFTPTYNTASYSVQPDQNEKYFSHTASVEGTYYTHSGWILSSDFNLTAYTGRAAGYNTTIPLWNASLSKQLFRSKAGELKFYVFDLLNQNKSVTRTIAENYVQDVQSNVLSRYFLVSFVYHLKSFNQQKDFKKMFPGDGPPDGMTPPNMPPPNMPPPNM